MDSLSRLIALVFVAVLCELALVQSAWAYGSVPQSSQPVYACKGFIGGNISGEGRSAAAACEVALGVANSSGQYFVCTKQPSIRQTRTFALGSMNGSNFDVIYKIAANGPDCPASESTGSNVLNYFIIRYAVSCPENSNQVGGSCECELGYKKDAGSQCVPYQCPSKNSYQPVTQPDVKLPNAGDGFCDGGCTFTPSSWKVDTGGQVWGVWPFKSGGNACGGKKGADGVSTGSDGVEPAPVPCGANQCPGNVNGANVCVPCRSQTTNGPSTAASGTQPTDAPSSDPDKQIKDTSSRTDCTGAVCTTTTEYKNGKGDVIGSKTEEESQESYCQKNPSANQCKKNSFGGACEAGFSCEGDAIQCALAQEVYRRNCQWFKDPPTATLAAGESAMAAGDRPAWHPASQAETKSFSLQGMLNVAELLPASCPSDRTVVINGAVYVVALSQMCGNLDLIGRCVVAMCLLAAAGIVFRGS